MSLLDFANLAMASYYLQDPLFNQFTTIPFLKIEKFQFDEVSGFIGYQKDIIYIVFTGTNYNHLKTFLDDIDIDLKKYGDGKVVCGFLNAWLKVEKYIYSKIENNKKIILIGHSLGGAIATLAYSKLKDYILELYTFGCPKVGDLNFSKNIISFRIVNINDIIPKLPPYCEYIEKEYLIETRKKFEIDFLKEHSMEMYLKLLKEII